MNRIYFWISIIVGCACSGIALAQDTSSVMMLNGQVVEIQDSSKIPDVHVINLTSRKGTVTNDSGEFALSVKLNDRILFSHLGYEVDTLLITQSILSQQDLIQFTLIETSYLLSIFSVLSISTFEEFERAFMALELPDDNVYVNIPLPVLNPRIPDNPAFTIYVPFDLSYFSKKARDLRKYRAMLEKDEKQQAIYARYNPGVVEKVTGISNEKEVEVLMEYCDFSDEFIKNAIDYDLYVAIIQCYDTYQEDPKVPDIFQD